MRSPDELTELFRATGRKVTAQRQCIFRVLQGDVTHPTAESVHAVARRRDGDDLAQDRLPDPPRAGRAGRDRRPRPRDRHDPVRPQRGAAPPPSRVPVAAARCATSMSTSPTWTCRPGADEGFDVGEAEVVFRGLVPPMSPSPAGRRQERRRRSPREARALDQVPKSAIHRARTVSAPQPRRP